MATDPLPSLEIFVAVARRGGFRSTATERGISPSAVSHAIAELERRLGVRLFNRTTRSVALTEAGERFLGEIAPALEAIGMATDRLQGAEATPAGVLRLNCAALHGALILEPFVLAYLNTYPDISVEIVTEGALVDIVGKGFDAGVRIAEALPNDMIAVPITDTLRSIVVGAPAYLDKYWAPSAPHDLLNHQCLRARMTSGRLYHWEFEKRGQSLAIDVPGRLTLDEGHLMRTAALAGHGLAMLPEYLVASDLLAGRLRQVLGDWTPAYPGLSLYYPSRRHMPAKLRAFIEIIRLERSRSTGR